MFKDKDVSEAKVVMNDISWFFGEFTSTLHNQQMVADQMPPENPTWFYYEERTVFRKRRPNNGTWIFEVGIESGENLPSWVIVGFMESCTFNEQTGDPSAFD